MINNQFTSFIVKLFIGLLVTLGFHLVVLHFTNNALFENRIILAYSINFLLATLIFFSLYQLRKKYLHILGFIFMAGSMLKFAFFFIFFNPFYKQDGELTSLEATSFLIPYLISLLIEVFFLSKMLNRDS